MTLNKKVLSSKTNRTRKLLLFLPIFLLLLIAHHSGHQKVYKMGLFPANITPGQTVTGDTYNVTNAGTGFQNGVSSTGSLQLTENGTSLGFFGNWTQGNTYTFNDGSNVVINTVNADHSVNATFTLSASGSANGNYVFSVLTAGFFIPVYNSNANFNAGASSSSSGSSGSSNSSGGSSSSGSSSSSSGHIPKALGGFGNVRHAQPMRRRHLLVPDKIVNMTPPELEARRQFLKELMGESE